MSRIVTLVSMLVAGLSLCSCAKVGAPPVQRLEAPSIQRLSGTWETDCIQVNYRYGVLTAIYANGQVEMSQKVFRDAECKMWLYTSSSLGSYVEHSLDTASLISKLDFRGNLPKSVSIPAYESFPEEQILTNEIHSGYSIVKIEIENGKEVLRLGTYSEGRDASSDEKRHTALSGTVYRRR